MTFLRPEILTALLLLAVPIIVHLFEFRIFKPTAFTNLLFLEDLKNEQHRYQKLKKWVILLLRLGYFSGLILAFALPTILNQEAKKNDAPVTVIYVDNSHSTGAKGASGTTLLSEAKEELYQWSKAMQGQQINWFTNEAEFPNQSQNAFQQSVLKLKASPKQLTTQQVLLRAKNIFERMGTKNPQLIWFTDFHNWRNPTEDLGIKIILRPLNAVDRSNIWLEKATVDQSDPENTLLSVLIGNNAVDNQTPTISVYAQDQLITQTGALLEPGQERTMEFDLGRISGGKGQIVLQDSGLSYDDTLFFNIPDQPQVKILSIGNRSSSVLNSIYDEKDFAFTQKDLSSLDYSLIFGQNLIILDQVAQTSNTLITPLKKHLTDGGTLVIIPEVNAFEATQNLLNNFNIGQVESIENQPRKLVDIHTNDPFYSGIFEKDFEVFQYPTIGQSLQVITDAKTLLSFEQGTAYLLEKDNVYAFTGPITGTNTNFDQSPLSVATMIQMARKTRVFPRPYYPTILSNNTEKTQDYSELSALIPGTLVADQVVVLKRGNEEIIPRQKQKQEAIEIDFSAIEFKPGHYQALIENDELGWFSFNDPRDESHGQFSVPDLDSKLINTSDNMNMAIASINQNYQGKQLWVWFAIFALICFLAEMFILKQAT